MGEADQWCRIRFVGPNACVRREWILEGPGRPDLGAVEMIARLALLAQRMGVTISVVDVSGELVDLLRLAALPIEVEGQPEGREQPLGVQGGEEEAHLDDPGA